MAPYFGNVLITGTPGTGKSTLAREVARVAHMQWIDLSNVIIEERLTDEYDSVYRSNIINERKVIKYLKPRMKEGGKIVDYHGCSFFPRHWFSAVFVIRTSCVILFTRLQKRGYSGMKLQDNIECENFQTLAEEARENYNPDVVHEIYNNNESDIRDNVNRIVSIIKRFQDLSDEEDDS